jgi:hypothetical protein
MRQHEQLQQRRLYSVVRCTIMMRSREWLGWTAEEGAPLTTLLR